MAESQNEFEEVSFAKKVRKGTRGGGEELALNINSMMDIMTILLVFLLVSITSDPWNVKQNQYMQLAKSTVDRKPEDSVGILVTKREIIVDDVSVVRIECVTATGRQCRSNEDYTAEGNRYFIDKTNKEEQIETNFLVTGLLKKLEEKMKYAKEVHAELGREERFKAITTIICDKDIPYRIISEVVYTAGNAGIDQLRFAVMSDSFR